jgi:hypothetical protein
VFLRGNLGADSIRSRKSLRLWDSANARTAVQASKLYFDYTVPLLEKITVVAKLGAKEYFIYYESMRPNEVKEDGELRRQLKLRNGSVFAP